MEEFARMISSLPAETQRILTAMAQNGSGLTARGMLDHLRRLLPPGISARDFKIIWGALMWLAQRGLLQKDAIFGALALFREAELAAAVAEAAAAGEAAGAGAAEVAAAGAMANIGAVLFALFTVYVAYDQISSEMRKKATPPPAGIPCTGTGPTTTVFTLSASGVGARTSYNRAVQRAMQHAGTVMTCTGTCTPPGTCTPVAIPISIVPRSRLFWTTTTITYMVGCACV